MMRLAADSILGTLRLICYLLTQHAQAKQYNQQVHPAIREDVKKLDAYIAQTRVMEKYQIHTPEQLVNQQTTLKNRITELERIRKPLYRKAKKAVSDTNKIGVRNDIDEITYSLKAARAELRVCKKEAEQKLPSIRSLLNHTIKDNGRSERLIR